MKASDISSGAVTAEIQSRVREQLRQYLLDHGASRAFEDPELFAEVERVLQSATQAGVANALILPELLGDAETWRIRTAMRYDSHRGNAAGAALMFVKRRVLMPVLRWLFEYSRDNFERQRHVNQVLFACVQELAIETARLRQELERQTPPSRPPE